MPRNTAYQLTHSAERALAAAARWASDDGRALEPPEVLAGLLSEHECRAAAILNERGIDAEQLRRAWPHLHPVDDANGGGRNGLSHSMLAGMRSVEQRLPEAADRVTFATEHLLWALTLSGHQVAAWLATLGVAADQLEAEVFRIYGYQVDHSAQAIDLAEDGTPVDAANRKSKIKNPKSIDVGVSSVSPPESLPPIAPSVARIVDAAANRAREAVRVVEDYVRFVADDRHLTERLKHLRHELSAALQSIPDAQLLAARDAARDVGATITTSAEMHRTDARHVAKANFKRLEESLRSLEEYAKTFDACAASAFERLRYCAYTLEKAVATLDVALDRLAETRLCVLIDARPTAAEFEALVASLVGARVGVIQLREKRLDEAALIERARMARDLTKGTSTLFVVNDSPQIAAAVEADGVHVGQGDASVYEVRAIVGTRAMVGVSTHSLEQARRAVLDGADYIGVGPVFRSGTKSFDAFPGVELVASVAREIRLPAFAIGGIDESNVESVAASGATRVAVSRAIVNSADPAAAARRIMAALDRRSAGASNCG